MQGWDLVHGQLLLHGWWYSDVNFYTLDARMLGFWGLSRAWAIRHCTSPAR